MTDIEKAKRARLSFILLWLGGACTVGVRVFDLVTAGRHAVNPLSVAVIVVWLVLATSMVPPFLRARRTIRADRPG